MYCCAEAGTGVVAAGAAVVVEGITVDVAGTAVEAGALVAVEAGALVAVAGPLVGADVVVATGLFVVGPAVLDGMVKVGS